MEFVRDKLTITQAVVSLLKEKNIEYSVEQVLTVWWKNPRRQGGLRLTDTGHTAFQTADLEYYTVSCNFKNIQTTKNFQSCGERALTLDRKIPCPYYIDKPKTSTLLIYDSRVYVLISMYGSLEEYLSL